MRLRAARSVFEPSLTWTDLLLRRTVGSLMILLASNVIPFFSIDFTLLRICALRIPADFRRSLTVAASSFSHISADRPYFLLGRVYKSSSGLRKSMALRSSSAILYPLLSILVFICSTWWWFLPSPNILSAILSLLYEDWLADCRETGCSEEFWSSTFSILGNSCYRGYSWRGFFLFSTEFEISTDL